MVLVCVPLCQLCQGGDPHLMLPGASADGFVPAVMLFYAAWIFRGVWWSNGKQSTKEYILCRGHGLPHFANGNLGEAALCKWKPGRSRYIAIPLVPRYLYLFRIFLKLVAKMFWRVGLLVWLWVSGAFGRTSHPCLKSNTALRLVLFILPDDTVCICGCQLPQR